MENINYNLLPEHIRGAMKRYIEDRIPPGGFLTAALSNDLVGAFGMADQINQARMRDIVLFLYNKAPMGCWGSPEKVKKWLGESGRDELR